MAGVAVVIANLWPESDLVEHRVSSPYGVADPQFVRAMSSLLGPALLDGNGVIELTNGEEAFPAMLAAIRHARHSITFETYIYWEGEIGAAFAAALAERARAGVRVHVLLDWLGSQKMDDENLTQLRRAGAEVVLYRRPRCAYRSFRYNDEANLNVYDADFARGQNAVLDADRARSREVTYAQWKRRPRSEKVRDRLSALLRWQL